MASDELRQERAVGGGGDPDQTSGTSGPDKPADSDVEGPGPDLDGPGPDLDDPGQAGPGADLD